MKNEYLGKRFPCGGTTSGIEWQATKRQAKNRKLRVILGLARTYTMVLQTPCLWSTHLEFINLKIISSFSEADLRVKSSGI